MPDASGRFKGMAVPSSAPWPPARELPAPYVPEDDAPLTCDDCGGEGHCPECEGYPEQFGDPANCGGCSGDGYCPSCAGAGEL